MEGGKGGAIVPREDVAEYRCVGVTGEKYKRLKD
jgi:hypothetical protein